MEKRRRHPLTTAWLVFMLVANLLISVAAIYYFLLLSKSNMLTIFPLWQVLMIVLLPFINVLTVKNMLAWNKYGFYVYCFTTTCGLVLNIMLGVNLLWILMGPIGLLILYAVLQLGSPSAWSQMEISNLD